MDALSDKDPIIAVATAAGRGGIGVLRLSGAALADFSQALLGQHLTPRHATYLPFKQANGELIDQGLALYFPAPHSYTGEDVLELHGHGGTVVMQLLMQRCLALAASTLPRLRLAQPGEFTRRAFLNNKLDLAQAEAVADLIEAQTAAAAKSAAASLAGVFSKHIYLLVEQLTQLRLLVEATLDFPEEEIEFLQNADALGQLQHLQDQLLQVLASAKQGVLLREGLKIVIAGLPNAGKSSLLNALAGEDVAIVTPIAGTTRDKVQQALNLNGIPITVIDTAGLRDTDDSVEAIGIARTWQEVARADVILHLHDVADAQPEQNLAIAARFPNHVPVLRVFNKIDLLKQNARSDNEAVYLSAHTLEGLNLLREQLFTLVGAHNPSEQVFMARQRHLEALRAAQQHLQTAQQHAGTVDTVSDRYLDLFAEELRLAQEQLGSITGEVSSDDLLGRIFSQFCIGK